ncbi:MAG: hypothetical protein KDI54_09135 [Gammaproteobacteria bacterium]|nr:hypothetical protein [Gammaproteobacteria bacterium]
MIEELTPQIMMVSMVLIILTTAVFTLILSVLLLWRYRRSVSRAMAAVTGFDAGKSDFQPGIAAASTVRAEANETGGSKGESLYRRAIQARLYGALLLLAAVFAFAALFALAAQFVYPSRLGLAAFLLAAWIYFWPAILALRLMLPGSLRLWVFSVVVYFLVFALIGALAATVNNLPEYRFGGIFLDARSTVTPWGVARLWLIVNGLPTLLIWFCFNRRIRAVAPLLLALISTIITGMLVVYFSIFSTAGVDQFVSFSVALDIHVLWLVVAALSMALLVFGALGWMLIRAIAYAYRRGRVSDRMLLLDALLLLFANSYGMWLVFGGIGWFAMVPAGFIVYRLVLSLMTRMFKQTRTAAQGLTFLRVFSLGRRSDALLSEIAGYWRYLGSVQMITGPDVVNSTVQPHQFLDFLSGRLSSHFIRDTDSLAVSLAQRERAPDPDGRFRINNLFCHEDSWQPALSQLVRAGDVVLMDLRSFSAVNAGCIHELRLLVRQVPCSRFVLVVDATTDKKFLRAILSEAWQQLQPEAPNLARAPEEVAMYRYEGGDAQLRQMTAYLCHAAFA